MKLLNQVLLSVRVTKSQLFLIVLVPFFFGVGFYLYINNQPDLYRVSINLDLQVLDKKAELKNVACTAYLSSGTFKKLDLKVKIADYWLSSLSFFSWLPDHSCFDINSMLLIKHFLKFYNGSKILADLVKAQEFVAMMEKKNISLLSFERYIASQMSFLTRQESLLLTIGVKGYDIEWMKFILSKITDRALVKTQDDITKAWVSVLTRLKTMQNIHSGKDSELVKNAINLALANDANTTNDKLTWNNQYTVEKIGPSKRSVTGLGVFLGLLLSFFAMLFFRRK